MQGQANHFRAMAGAYSAYGIKRYIDETKRLFDVLESRLSNADWLAGDKYTLADIASFSWVRAASIIELDLGKNLVCHFMRQTLTNCNRQLAWYLEMGEEDWGSTCCAKSSQSSGVA